MISHNATQSPPESALFDLCSLHVERIRALEVESQQLHNMFDQAPGFMAILRSSSHVYEIVNRAYYRLIGHRDSVGKSVAEVLPELVEQGYLALLDKVYSSGQPFVGREMLVTIQHEPNTPTIAIYVDFLYQPLFDSEGQVTGIFVQGQDVTEQKLTREALHASNERLKFALEGARDGIWDWSVINNAVAYSKNLFKVFLARC
jgi:PAS domain-containing protein